MRTLTVVIALCLTIVTAARTAGADERFHRLPGKGHNLSVKAVTYEGGTNGTLTVEIKNTGTKRQRFSAEGLYFVPDGDPDTAPQRLGAVGPLELAADDGEGRRTSVEVPAGASVVVRLDVFCIDSHRPSPSSDNTFTVGKTRMPRQLARTIEAKAKRAADHVGGYEAPAATSAIQSEVWKTRDRAWVKLDGEGVQEAHK